MPMNTLRVVTTLSVCLALLVVMLGAYTRLTNAGLGCPDWPGCYGHMVLSSDPIDLTKAQNRYPNVPIESRKAWTEMAHRYAAGTLAVLILIIGLSTMVLRRRGKIISVSFPCILILLVLFQAVLGMWTVTLKLLPLVVMGHLLGGILIFTGLSYFWLQLSRVKRIDLAQWRVPIRIAVLLIFAQIILGGWVSANYAGLACIGFPQCNGLWLPKLHFSPAFNLFSAIGENYQGGVLDSGARISIQYIHRLGALVVAGYILVLSAWMLRYIKIPQIRSIIYCALLLVILQFTLGVINVTHLLPLWSAVAHNGCAAMLLVTLVALGYLTQWRRANA